MKRMPRESDLEFVARAICGSDYQANNDRPLPLSAWLHWKTTADHRYMSALRQARAALSAVETLATP